MLLLQCTVRRLEVELNSSCTPVATCSSVEFDGVGRLDSARPQRTPFAYLQHCMAIAIQSAEGAFAADIVAISSEMQSARRPDRVRGYHSKDQLPT